MLPSRGFGLMLLKGQRLSEETEGFQYSYVKTCLRSKRCSRDERIKPGTELVKRSRFVLTCGSHRKVGTSVFDISRRRDTGLRTYTQRAAVIWRYEREITPPSSSASLMT